MVAPRGPTVSATPPNIDTAAVLKLPTDQKRALLTALLGDFSAAGVIQLQTQTGTESIYIPPLNAKGQAEQDADNTTLDELAELERRRNAPESEFIDAEVMFKMVEDEARYRERQLSELPAEPPGG